MLKKYFKKFIKTIGNNKAMRILLCSILAVVIKIIYKSGSFKHTGIENVEPFWQDDKPIIVACWHGRIMVIPFAWKGKKAINALISPHRDGLILSYVFKKMGVNVINGSSFKNATKAALDIKTTLDNKQSVVITPDGPRGPRLKLGKSMIYFAKISGAPILPVTFSAKPCKIFKSWDRFMFVYPFAKGIYLYEKPFYVPKDCNDETIEKLRIELEEKMINLQNNADRIMGLTPILPQE